MEINHNKLQIWDAIKQPYCFLASNFKSVIKSVILPAILISILAYIDNKTQISYSYTTTTNEKIISLLATVLQIVTELFIYILFSAMWYESILTKNPKPTIKNFLSWSKNRTSYFIKLTQIFLIILAIGVTFAIPVLYILNGESELDHGLEILMIAILVIIFIVLFTIMNALSINLAAAIENKKIGILASLEILKNNKKSIFLSAVIVSIIPISIEILPETVDQYFEDSIVFNFGLVYIEYILTIPKIYYTVYLYKFFTK